MVTRFISFATLFLIFFTLFSNLFAENSNPMDFSLEKPEINPALQMNERGELFLHIEGIVSGVEKQKRSQIRISVEGVKLKKITTPITITQQAQKFILAPGFSDVLNNAMADSQLQIEMNWDSGKQLSTLKLRQQDLVERLFNPIPLLFTFSQTTESITGEVDFEIPKELLKAKLALIHPMQSAQLRVNGKLVTAAQNVAAEASFNGARLFPLPPNEKKFGIKLTYDHREGEPQIPAALIIYEPQYQLFKQAFALKTVFPEIQFIPEKVFYAKLFKSISQAKWSQVTNYMAQQSGVVEKFSGALQQNTLHFVRAARLKLPIPWPPSETSKNYYTAFEKTLPPIEDQSGLILLQSHTQALMGLEKFNPNLFNRIKQQASSGLWTLVNGLWSDANLAISGGESIVRQLRYSQRFYQQKLGILPEIAWIPAGLELTPMLPQLLKQSGIHFLLTSEAEKFSPGTQPGQLFQWESPDGTPLLTFSPRKSDSGFTPAALISQFQVFRQQTHQSDYMIIFGDNQADDEQMQTMMTRIEDLQQRKIYPKAVFSTPKQFFSAVEKNPSSLPILKNKIQTDKYSTPFSTGTKFNQLNRKTESLLATAEKLASLTEMRFPQKQLEAAWKRTLVNQSRTILNGTNDPAITKPVLAAYDTTENELHQIIQTAVAALVKQVDTEGWGTPFIVVNPLAWSREGVVEIDLPGSLWGSNLRVSDADQWVVKSQPIGQKKLLLELTQEQSSPLPSLGYRIYHIQTGQNHKVKDAVQVTEWKLKNNFFEITFDPKTGNLASIHDLKNNREILANPGNELRFFKIQPENVTDMANNQGKSWSANPNPVFEIVENGPVRGTIRVTRSVGKSRFVQDVMVCRNLPQIDFKTRVEWNENDVLAQVHFPLNLNADSVTFENAYGWTKQPMNSGTTNGSLPHEIPIHRWIDLTDHTGELGVSLLNDSHYSCSVQKNNLSLTLFHPTTGSGLNPDKGTHQFTYTLYPHSGDWKAARTHQMACELNTPLITRMLPKQSGCLPNSSSFIALEGHPGVELSVVKKADDRDSQILRLIEYFGEQQPVKINFAKPLQNVKIVDLMENPLGPSLPISGQSTEFVIKPFEIKTLEVTFQ